MDEPAPVAAAHDVLTSPTTDKLLVFRRNGKVITDRLDQDGIPLDNRVYREKEYVTLSRSSSATRLVYLFHFSINIATLLLLVP